MNVKSDYAGILVAEDSPPNIQVLSDMLKGAGYRVRLVCSGRQAVQAAVAHPPELILLDISLPEMDGYEVCERLKANDRLADVPIIFISALNEQRDKMKAFSVGGVDYITKPFHFKEVEARVSTHVRLHRLQIEMKRHNEHLQRLVSDQVREIAAGERATICALSKLAEYRDEATGNHVMRVQRYCQKVATRLADMGVYREDIDDDFIENIFNSSPMHDIGKVASRALGRHWLPRRLVRDGHSPRREDHDACRSVRCDSHGAAVQAAR